jgi:membrane-associated phospholipid phosphatase
MAPVDPARLRRSDLHPLDRWAAGNWSPAAARASDYVILPLLAAPLALAAFDARAAGSGWTPVLEEALVLGEALAFSSALNLSVRSLRIHPRPFLYGGGAPESETRKGEASGSYYSGHASAAFLAATYLAYTYPRRHPEFKGRAWLWSGGLGAAAAVAGLRVAAGKHFPSDVATGAAAGALFGWLVPRLHLGSGGSAEAELRLLPAEEGVHPAVVVRF